MLDLQHQYNNGTTIPHMRVGPTYWSPPLCERLLYNYCIGVVQELNLNRKISKKNTYSTTSLTARTCHTNDNYVIVPINSFFFCVLKKEKKEKKIVPINEYGHQQVDSFFFFFFFFKFIYLLLFRD
jgi:hypothetical protein